MAERKGRFSPKVRKLFGMKALNQEEIDELKKDYTEMSDNHNQFFDNIRSDTLSREQTANYDQEFKKTGRKILQMINSILN